MFPVQPRRVSLYTDLRTFPVDLQNNKNHNIRLLMLPKRFLFLVDYSPACLNSSRYSQVAGSRVSSIWSWRTVLYSQGSVKVAAVICTRAAAFPSFYLSSSTLHATGKGLAFRAAVHLCRCQSASGVGGAER